ncbi:aldose 1-epimerase family protein [Saxibacter everestensis]|uniref:Aldose 1-epimerase family protein n=1 Tax=Saxibacter everestensis TaxID=2909229 RepID=A0ABY8QWA8_9MICO|nr:aldose 1-epimerase family protein [Brevibacteriaceae bacterium ZFBP1038]
MTFPGDGQPPSGEQFEIGFGDYRAVITAIGASLRLLQHKGRDLVVPFAVSELRPAHRGAVMVPWPNRIVDGHYEFDGKSFQLPLSEPARGHAIHGLVDWARFEPLKRSANQVVLGYRLPAQKGYPFSLNVTVSYTLDAGGLRTEVVSRNTGTVPAPYGVAAHPYLVAGPGRVDDWELTLPAGDYLETAGERLLPGEDRQVAGTAFDFRQRRVIGDTEMDHAFTRLDIDAAGDVRVAVNSPDGGGVELSFARLGWVQVFTADLPDPLVSRTGLAVEPMSCPPDAFNSGRDLDRLAAGADHSASWRISAL